MAATLEQPKLYTVPEFLAFLETAAPETDDDTEYELIGGQIMSRQGHTSGRHGKLVTAIATRLDVFGGFYAGEKQLGTVYSGASCTLNGENGINYPKPDVCFVLNGRTPPDFTGPIPVAPDLAVEVWSPSDTDEIRNAKIREYRAAGVRLIWSIYMLEEFVAVYRLNQPRLLLDNDAELDGGDVLPGFKLPLGVLFKK
jgi:Uma2 family endonuclease